MILYKAVIYLSRARISDCRIVGRINKLQKLILFSSYLTQHCVRKADRKALFAVPYQQHRFIYRCKHRYLVHKKQLIYTGSQHRKHKRMYLFKAAVYIFADDGIKSQLTLQYAIDKHSGKCRVLPRKLTGRNGISGSKI